jgi:hypothetical protein
MLTAALASTIRTEMRKAKRGAGLGRRHGKRTASPSVSQTTLGELVRFLDGDAFDAPYACLVWPPDTFALVASILMRSGAYCHVLTKWPPGTGRSHDKWVRAIQDSGKKWRASAANGDDPPRELAKWWRVVAAHTGMRLVDLGEAPAACDALLQLLAAADEASVSVGIPERPLDPYCSRAALLLRRGSLAQRVDPAKVRVFPKQHTPRSGLTLRSLSHHLALLPGGDVQVHWREMPQMASQTLNLLLAPWPERTVPDQFRRAAGMSYEMPSNFGLVEYHPRKSTQASARIRSLIRAARDLCGRVDGVLFPELALSRQEYGRVRKAVLDEKAFLVCGVADPPRAKGKPGRNRVVFDAPFGGLTWNVLEQDKHHRWRIDRGQIEMYGLGGHLDPGMDWWEFTTIAERQVHFVTLNRDVTVCCLICEDLARQDPVAEIVRSIGPNLVIALLMDAPQVSGRWPARYATVLADDPGSSVLTLTSVGMVDLAKAPPGVTPSRSVALWKDAHSRSAREIELPQGCAGILLNLCNDAIREWSADGRDDGGASVYPRLAGVHYVQIPDRN